MKVLRRRLLRVGAGVVVLMTGATGVAAAAPPTLDGTTLRGSLTAWSGCGDGPQTFTGGGDARGDGYPGVFTVGGTATLSGAALTAFGAQFSIVSGTTRVEATLTRGTSTDEAACTVSATGETGRVRGAFPYAATITSAEGVYRDEGVATVEITAKRSAGAVDGGDVRADFDSARTETVPSDPGAPPQPPPAPPPPPTTPAGAGATPSLTPALPPPTSSKSTGATPRPVRILRPLRRLELKGVAWNTDPDRVNVDLWGSLRLRPGMSRRTACFSQGTVRFVVRLGRRVIGRGATRVQRDCNFKKVVPAHTRGRHLVVEATFVGNRRLASATKRLRLTALR